MPFSRPRTVIASRISRDIGLLLDEVGTVDLGVRDRNEGGRTAIHRDRHGVVGGGHELAGERRVAVEGIPSTNPRAAAEVAAEVLWLGERAPGPGRGDLECVALAHLGQRLRDELAEPERDALRMIDEQTHRRAAHDLCEQDLDIGLAGCEPGLDICLNGAHLNLLTATKKAGERPLSVRHPARSRSESCTASLAPPPTPDRGFGAPANGA